MSFARPRSFFWSLTLSILAVLVLTAALQFVFVFLFVEPVVRSRQTDQAEELVAAVTPQITAALEVDAPERLPMLLTRYQRLGTGVFLAFDPVDGERILPRIPRRGMRGRGAAHAPGTPPVPDLAGARVLAREPVDIGGVVAGEVVALRPRNELALLRALPGRGLLLIPGALIATLLGGMWIFRRLQGRLHRLEEHARRVGAGDLGARIADPGEDEIGRLGGQLNAMSERLERARAHVDAMEAERKRLLADITHEISTPLTSIQGYAETLLDDQVPTDPAQQRRYLGDVLHAARRIGLLVDDLLDLTRLEAGASTLEFEELDLDALVRHSVDRHRPHFEAAGLSLASAGMASPQAVRADGRRLEQVVDNLLHNALRHVPSGGRVETEVRTEGRSVVLEVRDDGPGFPADALDRVFDRFYRAEASRTTPGSGLGLAIVREIVARHAGTAQAVNRPTGGACLVIRLPRAA